MLDKDTFTQLLAPRIEAAVKELEISAPRLNPDFKELILHASQSITFDYTYKAYLCYISYFGFSGTNSEVILDMALAIKLYNAAIELHDDVIDNDVVRREKLNTIGFYREKLNGHVDPQKSYSIASNMGLIGGDVLLGLVFFKLSKLDADETTKGQILRHFHHSNMMINAGQQIDELLDIKTYAEITRDDILNSYCLKTGYFSHNLALKAGAILAGATEEQLRLLSKYCLAMGVAIQIANDLTELFYIDNDKTGSDVRQNKKTFVMLQAQAACLPQDWSFIESLHGRPTFTTEEVNQLRNILISSGARASAAQTAFAYAQYAYVGIEGLSGLNSEATNALLEIIESMKSLISKSL